MKFQYHFSKIYMRFFFLNFMWGTIDLKYGILTKILVIFATIEIMSKKKGK